MKILKVAITFCAAASSISCGEGSAGTSAEMAGTTETNSSAYQPGSGIYGSDCEAATGRYEVILIEGEDGFVSAQVTDDSGLLEGLLTSYSYMGDATPTDFLVAILFDPVNSPVPESDTPRIEIWKGERTFYALVNGNEDERLDYCADVPG